MTASHRAAPRQPNGYREPASYRLSTADSAAPRRWGDTRQLRLPRLPSVAAATPASSSRSPDPRRILAPREESKTE